MKTTAEEGPFIASEVRRREEDRLPFPLPVAVEEEGSRLVSYGLWAMDTLWIMDRIELP